ncbi:MAG: redox-sensing transcriptional repressor Rex [Planctomycetaceae bacterium]|nr:MAG: redox-sensing transcriptional repressor Rex [Planctomycetaceae bacterium]
MCDDTGKSYPLPSVRRMPMYLQYLKQVRERGRCCVSCTHIAEHLHLNSIQVRKDLAMTGIVGRPKTGYEVEPLIEAVEEFLGWNNTHDAFLVGVGSLGRALLGYEGFHEYGLEIIAGFEKAVDKIGQTIHGKEILDIETLPGLARRMHVQIGILTVPAQAAQEVTDLMVGAGIRAIWNYTPVQLDVPPAVVVEDVRMAASFAVLSLRLTELVKCEKSPVGPSVD